VTPRPLLIASSVLLIALFGLGFYALSLKHRAEQLQVRVDERPIAPPVAGPVQPIALLLAQDSDGRLHRASVSAPLPAEPGERARAIVRALLEAYRNGVSQHQIPDRSEVNAVYIVNGNLAVVDLNSAFADGHASGILPEELSIASIAETLSANMPAVTQVKILVDGKERETLAGHADLKAVYDVASMSAFVDADSGTRAANQSN
jgi:Sporulation and spore germination